MKPASSSGMIVDMPSPAGVIAPVRLMPTVTSSSSMTSVYSRQPSGSRPALYARNALPTSSAPVSRPLGGVGSMRGPRRKAFSLRGMMVAAGRRCVVGRRLQAPPLARLPHQRHRFARAVGQVQQVEILGGDFPLARHPLGEPGGEPRPVVPAEQDDREVLHLAGLDQGERLE